MRLVILLALALMLTCRKSLGSDFHKLHLVQGCTILDMKGWQLKQFPGIYCLFLDDGSFISASSSGLRLFSKTLEIKWELPGHFHHQLNLSRDKNKILALSSDLIEKKSVPYRDDKLMIISLEGKILQEQKASFLLKEAGEEWLTWPTSWMKDNAKTNVELSHFNSFYELPEGGNRPENIKEGGYIINGNNQGFFVVSYDLKKLLYHRRLKDSWRHYTHDVQLTPRGTILFFNNIVSGSPAHAAYSAVVETDLSGEKKIWEFSAQPKFMFYSKSCGSVQELDDDHVLFSDHMNGTFVFSRKKNELIHTIRGTHFRNGEHKLVEKIRAENLTRFLSHHL